MRVSVWLSPLTPHRILLSGPPIGERGKLPVRPIIRISAVTDEELDAELARPTGSPKGSESPKLQVQIMRHQQAAG
jgi:hypothetical protein